jgi:CRP-like cAMP-binding protein
MIRKLDSIFRLSDEEKHALQNLPVHVQVLKADQDIVRIGDSPSQSCLLVDGYTCVYKLTAEGKRQIVAFHVPGDIPEPEGPGQQPRHGYPLYGWVHPARGSAPRL